MSLSSQQINYGSNSGRYIEISGRKVYYEEYGSGETVLLLHGGPGSIANFSKLIPELSKHYHVIAMDTPGQGHSERADDNSYTFFAQNASAFIDLLDIKKCKIVGWSDGAVTGLLLAALRPDVIDKVFASGGFAQIDGFTDKQKEFWSTLTPQVVEDSWGGWHLSYQEQYPQNDWRILISDLRSVINKQVYITEEQLMKISCNVLLAYGDRDLFTFEHIIYLHKTIQDSELFVLPGTSHDTFQEKPEMMSEAILKFFSK